MEIRCGSDARRSTVKDHPSMNGIDYLEIRTLQNPGGLFSNPLLIIRCFKAVTGIGLDNVLILGGVRVKNVEASWAYRADELVKEPPDPDLANLVSPKERQLLKEIEEREKSLENVLAVRASDSGDFSKYELRLVRSKGEPDVPPDGFDAILSREEFSFKVECESKIDCKCLAIAPQTPLPEPAIDYMAKDYASFRKLILDRLSLITPDWKERNPADIGMAMVELLAYTGDHLSYYQDAVATEAYLGTARRRVSAARHARLLDYPVHDGCNARAWVRFNVEKDGLLLQKRTVLLTKTEEKSGPVVQGAKVEDEIIKGSEAFETMYDVTFYQSKNEISFYPWGETDCWLAAGSTSATVKNDLASIDVFVWEKVPGGDTDKLVKYLASEFGLDWLDSASISKTDSDKITIEEKDGERDLTIKLYADKAILEIEEKAVYQFDVATKDDGDHLIRASCLGVGDVLIFKEDPASGDDGQSRSHPVRVTHISTGIDELTKQRVLEIEWEIEDALPFPLCIEKDGAPASIIYGNVVLADHGYTKSKELESRVLSGKYYPRVGERPLTRAGPPFEITAGKGASAASAFNYDLEDVQPSIRLTDKRSQEWNPHRDLFSSDEFAREFVVETESDNTAFIRFNDTNRRNWAEQIEKGSLAQFTATFRIGNGRRGNVGSGAISRIFVSQGKSIAGIKDMSNPMAAKGGQEPETIDNIRQFASHVFRNQERAVSEADYEEVLKRHPNVYRAAAKKRWTGSWHTMFVAIDRKGGLDVDSEFKTEIVGFLEKYRLAGYDVEVQGPIYIPLRIVLEICIKGGYFEGEIRQQLIKVFSNRLLEDGSRGFFHPDNFTFGQPLYLSKVYEAGMSVEGVSSVVIKTFQRWGKEAVGELDQGVIETSTQEIVRLDNDPNFAENGMIEFIFCGGV